MSNDSINIELEIKKPTYRNVCPLQESIFSTVRRRTERDQEQTALEVVGGRFQLKEEVERIAHKILRLIKYGRFLRY